MAWQECARPGTRLRFPAELDQQTAIRRMVEDPLQDLGLLPEPTRDPNRANGCRYHIQ